MNEFRKSEKNYYQENITYDCRHLYDRKTDRTEADTEEILEANRLRYSDWES